MKNKADLENMLKELEWWLSTGYKQAKNSATDNFLNKMVKEIEKIYSDVIDNHNKEKNRKNNNCN